jgi:three-Cys-motif partner protein
MRPRRTGNGRDSDRNLEEHRQTEQKLEVARRYDYVWAVILAQYGRTHPRQDYFIVDTHAGPGQHKSIERLWVPGTTPMACFAARRVQQVVPTARVHVRSIEINPEDAADLEGRVRPFRRAGIDVEVMLGDYRAHLGKIEDEIASLEAPALWLVDPHGIDIDFGSLAALRKRRFGQEVIVNLDAGGALRAQAAPAKLDDLADLEGVLIGSHSPAVNRLWGGHDWIDTIEMRGRTWRENLTSFARGYARQWAGAYKFTAAYPLRSSHNQVRYLVHLANHDSGYQKFREEWEASQDFGLLAPDLLDEAGAFPVAEGYHAYYKSSTTTVDQLFQERFGAYNKRQLIRILVAAENHGLGNFDLSTRTMEWYEKRRDLMALEFKFSAG